MIIELGKERIHHNYTDDMQLQYNFRQYGMEYASLFMDSNWQSLFASSRAIEAHTDRLW